VFEKPEPSPQLHCGMGIYVLTRAAISWFAKTPVGPNGERGITPAIQCALDNGVAFSTISYSGFYRNVNTPADLDAAESQMARLA
jgi:dTDP-glucose pyrophosphorylase